MLKSFQPNNMTEMNNYNYKFNNGVSLVTVLKILERIFKNKTVLLIVSFKSLKINMSFLQMLMNKSYNNKSHNSQKVIVKRF